MYVSVYTGLLLYIYTHISALCCWEGLRRRKRMREEKRGEEGPGNTLLQAG